MSDEDWVSKAFPGDPLEHPTDAERDRADGVIAWWSERWKEEPHVIDRTHPVTTDEGYANTLCGLPTNRAYMRARLRRWWKR